MFEYSRAEVIAGQWWRLLSCHFVHLNASHWLANMVATLLIGMLVTWRPNVRLIFVIGVTVCFLTSLLIHLLWPYVSWYVGLSGVLHGLLVLVGTARKDAVGVAVLLLLLVKLSAEQMMAMGPWMASSIPVLEEGHLAGALAGVIVLMSFSFGSRHFGNWRWEIDYDPCMRVFKTPRR